MKNLQNQTNLRKIAITTANLVEHEVLNGIKLEVVNTNSKISTSTKITALAEIIDECSNFITAEKPSATQMKDLDTIQSEIIQFIGQNPDIVARESHIYESDSPSLIQESLLHNLASRVQNQFSIKIFNYILSTCGPLRDREGLLSTMFENRAFTSNPDMSETFDLLAQRWLPLPSESQMDLLMTDPQFREGKNASKIAKSFFLHQNDNTSLIHHVLQHPENIPDKKALRTYLASDGILNASSFAKHIDCIVEVNDSALLETALRHRELHNFLRQSGDHCSALDLAVKYKFTKTFDMLIDAGFNPLKHHSKLANPFALACKDQSRAPLESYLNSVEKKYGTEVVTDLINEVSDEIYGEGKSALTYAIEGKAYIDAIQLLLDRGANSQNNNLLNLGTCILHRHAAALDLLIKINHLEQNDLNQLNKTAKAVKDPVIDSILLSYVRTYHPDNKKLAEEITQRHAQASTRVDPQELFRICQNGSELHLQDYTTRMEALNPSYTLSSHINELEDNKTPLYYAINDNAYDRLIKKLLENGANVDLIGYDNETKSAPPINALSFAIQKKQSGTLKTLLSSENILPETLLTATDDLIKPQNNNALLTSSFVENLTNDQLVLLPARSRQVLLKRSLESDLDRSIEKIKGSFAQTPEVLSNYVDDLFLESIKNNDNKMFNKLLEKFAATIQGFASPSSSNSTIENSTSETTSLLRGNNGHNYATVPNSSINSSASSTSKLSDSHKKYLDAALDAAIQTTFEKEDSAKAIIKTLREKGFETSKTKNEYKIILKSLDLDYSYWCCPTDYNVCRIM